MARSATILDFQSLKPTFPRGFLNSYQLSMGVMVRLLSATHPTKIYCAN